MRTQPELAHLRRALRAVQARSGMSIAEASEALERHPKYLTRVLNGRLSLKVAEVFALLEVWKVHPADFLDTYFPLGGSLAARLLAEVDAQPDGPFARLPRLVQQMRVRTGADLLSSADWTERLADLLNEKILASPLTQREVSQRLELPPSALGQALRGNSELLFSHVFGALRVISMSPGRFFFEVFAYGLPMVEGLRLSEVLDELDRILQRAAKDFVRELARGPTEDDEEELLPDEP